MALPHKIEAHNQLMTGRRHSYAMEGGRGRVDAHEVSRQQDVELRAANVDPVWRTGHNHQRCNFVRRQHQMSPVKAARKRVSWDPHISKYF